ncbi:hypothetical protein F5146DRAFT_1130268 [Armillaria mellea]|nr:hypothetical protein F5146DRAFT_1130268 [Armillaria mellea]
MSNEPQPVSLAQLLCSSQTAHRRPAINPERLLATATPPAPAPAPAPAHNSDLIANHGNIVNLSPSHPALSPLMRMTGTGIYPALPMHTTGNSTTVLPQLPVHRLKAEKKDNPHIQRGYTLPESDVYNLEETDVAQFRTHMTKLDLCIMYCTTTDDTYKDIHAQLLAHNTDLMKPKIPGLKSDNLDSLMFENMGWCFLQLATRKPYHALLTYNKKHTEDQSNLSYMIQYASLESKFNRRRKKKPSSMPGQFTIVIAPTTAPICHNLHNRNLIHAWAMKTNYLAYVHAEASAPTNSEETFQSITVSQIVLIGAIPMLQHSRQGHSGHANKHPSSPMAGPQHVVPVQSLSPIRPVKLGVLPLPAPHYASLIWPDHA